jgi:hypothetical protein
LLTEMRKVNEELVKAGVILDVGKWARCRRRRTGLSAPFDRETAVEIRPVFEAEDFGENITPEAWGREEHLRAKLSRHVSGRPACGGFVRKWRREAWGSSRLGRRDHNCVG